MSNDQVRIHAVACLGLDVPKLGGSHRAPKLKVIGVRLTLNPSTDTPARKCRVRVAANAVTSSVDREPCSASAGPSAVP